MAGKNLIMTEVLERDVDLLLIRTFMENREYMNGFLGDVGISGSFELDKARSSLSDDSAEADITLIITDGNRWLGLLIENQIDGNAKKQSAEDYTEMGKTGVAAGMYDDYRTVLIGPEAYIETNPEKDRFDCSVTYERLGSFFLPRSFEKQLLVRAIEGRRDSFVSDESALHTAFWTAMRTFVKENYPKLKMADWQTPRMETRAKWCSFELAGDGEKQIVFKADRCFVDLVIPGMESHYEDFMTRNREFLSQYPYVAVKWDADGLKLRMMTIRPVDFTRPFEHQVGVVSEALTEVLFLQEQILPGLVL